MTILAVTCAVVYALIWLAWAQHWTWLDTVDRPSLEAMYGYGVQHPGWVTGWDVFCNVFSPNSFRVVGLVVAAVAAARRYYRIAVFLVVSIGLSGPVSVLAKALTDRPRPSTALVSAPSSSLPSGHAVGVTVGVLALMVVLLPLVHGWARPAVIAAGAVTVIVVGVARVILNVHHPSDVIAGWALGYVYFYLCLIVIRPGRPAAEPVGAT
jgi:undecaprenyl-diphosphatase